MSDDDYDEGDFEGLDDLLIAEADEPLDELADEDLADELADEAGLDEDAAGTDEDEELDEGIEDSDPVPQKAQPSRQKEDPILQQANQTHSIILVLPEDRVTSNVIQKSEAARAISIRAEQIAKYATSYGKTREGHHDPVEIAIQEFLDGKSPLKLRRQVGYSKNGDRVVEEWSMEELTRPAALGSILRSRNGTGE